MTKVYVVCANDFPETVRATEQEALQFIADQGPADAERQRQRQAKIHWRYYDFDLEPTKITDRPLSDFRSVDVVLENSTNTYIVLSEQTDRFVKATVRLHHDPGVNPSNQNKTEKLVRITIREFGTNGPYWWSTPDLGRNNDPNGALIVQQDYGSTVTVWEAPAPTFAIEAL